MANPHEAHWVDEAGHVHGTCFCGSDCSTHPDAANPLDCCADCGADTCYDHREYVNNAPICLDCLQVRALSMRRDEWADVISASAFRGLVL